ncbi:competence ComEA helix-hairpin-helix repeat region domain protein [Yersinia rohdei]|uniref:Competence ComEA helix-hairpin-helix repeat region domain protein n=1 Tax=Yersinia rohdei TaxID=29485 RepID=A0ABM5SFH9_YERRO|nr:ComEA family DNA-binding protein [Yersinia rohdei]AJJ12079.1 competence ComEA helix-hairpin-helix repeat region domain protein [Yersinia rohdei]EEQ02923.1 Competence protein ComEA helix-hairpin-helix repeat protein [Yersinia rohdei ATCC 43380]CQJ53279.1 competence protein ComEA [Yersinia rohdei]
MKYLGKLFVIAGLLVGFNLQLLAHTAPVSPTSSSQEKVLNRPANATATNKPVNATQDKMTVTATAGRLVNSHHNQINVNSADAEQLAQFLNGIGKKKAEAIVNYREQFGPFTDAEQLLEVPGIGPSFLDKNSTKIKL